MVVALQTDPAFVSIHQPQLVNSARLLCARQNSMSHTSGNFLSEASSSFVHPLLRVARRRSTTPQSIIQTSCSEQNRPETTTIAIVAGLISNPVVLCSLISVVNTRSGLPAGPFGLLGGLEGVSYLVIVGFTLNVLRRQVISKDEVPTGLFAVAETLSLASVIGGLAVLLFLVKDAGCVPNAKPLLDYSEILPVCRSVGEGQSH